MKAYLNLLKTNLASRVENPVLDFAVLCSPIILPPPPSFILSVDINSLATKLFIVRSIEVSNAAIWLKS